MEVLVASLILGLISKLASLAELFQGDDKGQHKREARAAGLVGESGIVTEDCRLRGTVKIGRGVWDALSGIQHPLLKGEKVYVWEVDGCTLIVGCVPPPEVQYQSSAGSQAWLAAGKDVYALTVDDLGTRADSRLTSLYRN